MSNILDRIIIEPFDRLIERLLQFLPDIFVAILIFVTGVALSMVFKLLLSGVFRAVRLDKILEKSGAAEVIRKGGIKEPISHLLARMVGWVTIISFSIISLRTLNFPAIERILERFILYLPNIFIAAIILFLGYFLAIFFGRAALIASVNAGFKLSGLVGRLVKLSIFSLAVTMALEQLGIGRETIIIAFAIMFGGVVFALSLAFGLGARDIAKEYLERKMKGEETKDDISHL